MKTRKKDEFDKLSDKEVEKAFNFMISEDMTEKEFGNWYYEWFDPSTIIDIAEGWDVKDKREDLRNFYGIKLSRLKKILNENED